MIHHTHHSATSLSSLLRNRFILPIITFFLAVLIAFPIFAFSQATVDARESARSAALVARTATQRVNSLQHTQADLQAQEQDQRARVAQLEQALRDHQVILPPAAAPTTPVYPAPVIVTGKTISTVTPTTRKPSTTTTSPGARASQGTPSSTTPSSSPPSSSPPPTTTTTTTPPAKHPTTTLVPCLPAPVTLPGC